MPLVVGAGECYRMVNTASDLDPGGITKFWEVESSEPDQITEVQGRLKLRFIFGEMCFMPPSYFRLHRKWVLSTT